MRYVSYSPRYKQHLSAALVAAVLAACTGDPHSEMLEFARSGDAYASQGKLSEAIIEYRNAVQKEPRAGDVRVKLAEAYIKNGEPAKALQEYVRAADVLPDAAVQLKAGSLLLMARRFDDAKARAEKALAADAKSVDAQILLANALAGLKNLDAAIAELEQAIQLNPDRSSTYTTLGSMEMGRGRRTAAEKAFKQAVALAPRSAAAHLALASFYWAAADWAGAERALTEALGAEPDNALAHRTAATFYLVTNRGDRAEQHLRRVLDITKTSAAAIVLSDYYVAQNKEAAARELLEPLAKDPTTSSAANTRLAALDHAGGRSEEASKRLDAVLKTEPKQLAALLIKSNVLFKAGKLEEALRVATAATQAHADSPAAFSAVGRMQIARHDHAAAKTAFQEAIRLNPLATDAKIALARLEMASGDAESSARLAEDALKAQPENANARLLLVQALIARGETERASSQLDIVAATFPDSAAVHTQRGMLYARKKQPVEARRELERALQLQPDLLEASAGLVTLDLLQRRLGEARTRVDELVRNPGTKPAALMLAARTYAALGDLKTSEHFLRRSLTGDPTYLPAYAALGQIYAKQGRLDAALAEFEALAQRDPRPVSALTMAGMMLEAQGKTAEARGRFERAMQLDPSAPVAANNLAWLYAQSGENLDLALQLAETAKRKLPDTPEVSDTLGFIYYKKGLFPQAIRVLHSAVEKEGSNPGFHYHLGLALAKGGDKAKATEHLTRALSLKPDFEGAAEARELLKNLGS